MLSQIEHLETAFSHSLGHNQSFGIAIIIPVSGRTPAHDTSPFGIRHGFAIQGFERSVLEEHSIMTPDVVYTVVFMKDKKYLASPTVLGEFGREVSVEVANEMRVLALSRPPDQEGRSFTSAKMFLFEDNAWQLVKEMTMEAYLSMTPSFEYSVPDTVYRFVVMQRLIVPAANESDS